MSIGNFSLIAGLGALFIAILAVWFAITSGDPIEADVYVRRRWQGPPVRVTLITTNDLHSNADGCCGPDSSPDLKKGGYDTLLHTIAAVQRNRSHDATIASVVLTLDAGDWFSGTIFSSVGPSPETSSVPEIAFFAAAGYDAVVVGNHDFDAGVLSLRRMLGKRNTSSQSDFRRPAILSTNLADADALPGVLPWLVKEVTPSVNGAAISNTSEHILRIGIFGLLGVDGAFASRGNRASSATFTGYNDSTDARDPSALHARARDVVSHLRLNERCDLVICLFHGGTDEDTSLARAVPGIDAVVAGHTHELYYRRVERSPASTHIWQCGSEGAMIGILDFELSSHGGLIENMQHSDSTSHCFVVERASSKSNVAMAALIDEWRNEASHLLQLDVGDLVFNSTNSFLNHNLTLDWICKGVNSAILEQLNRDLQTRADLVRNLTGDSNLGNVSTLLGECLPGREPFHVYAYLSCVDCVRSEIHTVNGQVPLLVSDVFRMMGVTGNREVSLFYISKQDLRNLCDLVDLLFRFVSPIFALCISSNVQYDLGWGIPFVNRVKRFTIDGVDYENLPDRLLIGTNGYIAPFFWRSESLSHGLIKSLPLDARGDRIPSIDLETTMASGLPVEYEILLKFLMRQPRI